MATDTAHKLRRRLRRPPLPDLLLAAFLALLATAVVVNGVTTAHDIKRVRLDKKVAARWFKGHPALGRFGPPRIKVGAQWDRACAARRSTRGDSNPIDGYCILIADRDARSANIMSSYRCFYPRAAKLAQATSPRCLARH
jgi:hypothetical protein